MDPGLHSRTESPDAQVRIPIAAQQDHLKEEHGRGPHGRPTPEPGQDILRDQRLYLKEQERADENGQCVRHHVCVSGTLLMMQGVDLEQARKVVRSQDRPVAAFVHAAHRLGNGCTASRWFPPFI